MSQNSLSPHDPKFTAYALGELDPAECAAVESALRDNPAACAVVEEIRAVAAQLSAALAAEPLVEATTAAQPARAAIIAGRDHRKFDGGPLPYAKKKLIKFPEFYYISGLAAAACFAVFASLQEPKPHPRKQIVVPPGAGGKVYTVLDLINDSNATPPPSGKNEETAEAGMAVLVVPSLSPVRPQLQLADARLENRKSEPLLEPAKADTDARASAKSLAFSSDAGQRPATITTPVPPQAASSARADVTLVAVADTAQVGSVAQDSTSRIESNGPQLGFSPPPRPEQLSEAGVPSSGPLPLFNSGGVAVSRYEVSVDKDGVSYMRGIPAGPVAGSGATSGKQAMQLTPLVVSNQSGGPAVSTAMSGASQNFLSGESLGMPSGTMPSRLPRGGGADRPSGTSEGDFVTAKQNRVSTFPLDVDPVGYVDVRRMIKGGRLPPAEAVRIEEMVNYFPFTSPSPSADHPVAAAIEVASAPWAPTHRLVLIGLKAQEIPAKPRAAANLVFLVDVSASMNEPNKLSLVKESIRSLVGRMRSDDQVAIVTYAGRSGLALPSTSVANSREIFDALDVLQPRESLDGAMGIQLAYDIARAHFVTGGPNRVILCTDGDLNLGVSDERELARLISDRATSGVLLSVLGL
ncbi:MAG: von Willebrand factor type A domain-containing protein, partial [Opitutaceae bacterium]